MTSFTFPAFGYQSISLEVGADLLPAQRALVMAHLITTSAWLVRSARLPAAKARRYLEALATDLAGRARREERTLRAQLGGFVGRARSFEPDAPVLRGPIDEVGDALAYRRYRPEPGEALDPARPWPVGPELRDSVEAALRLLLDLCDGVEFTEPVSGAGCRHGACQAARAGDWYRACRLSGIDPLVVRLLHRHAERAGFPEFEGRAAQLKARRVASAEDVF